MTATLSCIENSTELRTTPRVVAEAEAQKEQVLGVFLILTPRTFQCLTVRTAKTVF